MHGNTSMTKNPSQEYGASSIRVIEGLEAVRKRPAMYIGSTGPQGLHHLVYEAVDNSIDEALAGHCDTVTVTLHKDGSCSVEDNGRGIPTGIHPTEGISATEVVLTKLHAGGKFEKEAYKFSGGLHGVGISVVNALSQTFEVTVFQNGHIYYQKYHQGHPVEPLKVIGDTKKRGTLVRFLPDPAIFQETVDFQFDTLSTRLRELAFLNKNVRITLYNETTDAKKEFHYEGGIISFVEYINKKKTPLFPEIIYLYTSDEQYILEMAMQYNDSYGEQTYSFVNNINTVEGGTHLSGFRSALTKICNKKAIDLGIIKSGGENFSSEDVREGLVCVLSIKVPEPQFEGQTKTKLGNSEVKGLVDSWVFSFLDRFFEENPAIVKKILQKAEIARRARDAAKKARELTRRKTVLESTILPGKLADCSNEEPAQSELFIVEGESAGGTAKQGRDRNSQAILPLKGKILNVEKARIDRVLSNDEIKALIAAIGCGISSEFDITKARYHRIILMTDADIDGSHIRTLLLTFFFRYMVPLIEHGYLYIAQPPLYKAKIGKKEQYLKDDRELKGFLFDWAREQTSFSINDTTSNPEDTKNILEYLKQYDDALQRVTTRFSLPGEYCHKLAYFTLKNPTARAHDMPAFVAHVQQLFPEYVVSLHTVELPHEDEESPRQETFVRLAMISKLWDIPLSFFNSPEIERLHALLPGLESVESSTWKLGMINRERAITGNGIMGLLQAIYTLSKSYLHIQRYKGLGEMNADQLWDTAMDPKTRLVLKVTMEDALEADRWFTTLMGDDVSGRKEYIEQFGRFVKNLDV